MSEEAIIDKKEDEAAPRGQVLKFTGFGLPDGSKLPDSAVRSNAVEVEDEFKNFYLGSGGNNEREIIVPPFNPRVLRRLCSENNALQPCIDAMVTNIDGTGFEFTRDDLAPEDADKDPEILKLWDFFLQPWPGETFIQQRKRLREDLEQTGNAYLEVIRNARDEIVFLRPIDAVMMRMVRLDDPYPALKTVKRNNTVQRIRVAVRERRFVQMVNTQKLVYFKEFGSDRDLDKDTGRWSAVGTRLPFKKRATEVIHLFINQDAATPYGLPRWINQMPSVLGSRKAEEFNLDFFDNGGVPPVLILLQGGVLGAQTREAIQKQNQAPAKQKSRMMVIEAEPTGGGLDSPGTARVTVERFGSERQNDSMFEKYDDKSEQRVRRSFRLPPIFVGAAEDYSFATAYTSYTVAEAQVFKPERSEFDDIITLKLLPALGAAEGYMMRSLPMQIEDITMKLKGIEMLWKTGHANLKDVVREINRTINSNIKFEETYTAPEPPQGGTTVPGQATNPKTGVPHGKDNPVNTR